MTISQLVTHLEEIKSKHGDVLVCVFDSDSDEYCELSNIKFKEPNRSLAHPHLFYDQRRLELT